MSSANTRRAWSWFYARAGQLLCFWLGGALFISAGTYPESEHPVGLLGYSAFLITAGLVLRAMAIWRPREDRE